MRNYIRDGNTITVTAPANVVAGGVFQFAAGDTNCIGIYLSDAANGQPVEVQIDGVVRLPKNNGVALGNMTLVYWHTVNGNIQQAATGAAGTRAGRAFGDFLAADTFCLVKLNAG